MKREITVNFQKPKIKEEKKQVAEEFIVYGHGAGLYSHLNALAEQLSLPNLNRAPFELHQ